MRLDLSNTTGPSPSIDPLTRWVPLPVKRTPPGPSVSFVVVTTALMFMKDVP